MMLDGTFHWTDDAGAVEPEPTTQAYHVRDHRRPGQYRRLIDLMVLLALGVARG